MFAVLTAVGARAQTSPHGKLEFACEQCHTSDSWKEMPVPSRFDHIQTGFRLRGQHAQVKCVDCHASLTFKKAGRRCVDCHEDVHRGELGATCDRCHSSASWLVPDMVQRHAATRFALVGAHATVACQACHMNEQMHEYVGVRTDCYGCHAADFEGSVSPNHRSAGFSTDCTGCHQVNAMSWGGPFDHSRTGFPLAGAHQAVACVQCHANNVFRAAPTQCYSCHGQQFASANAPPHTGFPTDCTTCHTMIAWQPASFDHSKTAFPLTGAHAAVLCNQCHLNNVFAGLSMQCYSCHGQQFASASAPPHTGFPTDCATCHTTSVWQPSTFDHGKSIFPLVGAHQAVACVQCHVNNVYVGLPLLCYGCHQQQFASTNAPPHTGFPTDCTTCHTMSAWQPATFDHSKTLFPLTGGHVGVACARCHVNNVYAGLPTACYSCHQADYAGTTNPAHASVGFPTDCTQCHSTANWTSSTYNHDAYFPIATGATHHPGVWNLCSDCHNVATNYATFCCINCHTHQPQSAVDAQHQGRSGYSYTCTSCYSCHARGGGG